MKCTKTKIIFLSGYFFFDNVCDSSLDI